MSSIKKLTFEDKSNDLDELLIKNKTRWNLNFVTYMDFDDVCQIIRMHIYVKWDKWDQSRPFNNWASRVIKNRMSNLLRDNFNNFKSPCVNCEFNMGGYKCGKNPSGKQDKSCPLYDKWDKKKKYGYGLKTALPIEDYFEYENYQSGGFQNEDSIYRIHSLMLDELKGDDRKIYTMLFIENRSDEEVAKKFKLTIDLSSRRKGRFKNLELKKDKFKELMKKIIKSEDL